MLVFGLDGCPGRPAPIGRLGRIVSRVDRKADLAWSAEKRTEIGFRCKALRHPLPSGKIDLAHNRTRSPSPLDPVKLRLEIQEPIPDRVEIESRRLSVFGDRARARVEDPLERLDLFAKLFAPGPCHFSPRKPGKSLVGELVTARKEGLKKKQPRKLETKLAHKTFRSEPVRICI